MFKHSSLLVFLLFIFSFINVTPSLAEQDERVTVQDSNDDIEIVDPDCDKKATEKYSLNGDTYALFTLCNRYANGHDEVILWVNKLQRFGTVLWGDWDKRYTLYVAIDTLHRESGSQTRDAFILEKHGRDNKFQKVIGMPRSGNYDITVTARVVANGWEKGDELNVKLFKEIVVGPDGLQAAIEFKRALAENEKSPFIYVFDKTHPIPIKTDVPISQGYYTSNQEAVLLAIPKASKTLIPSLLGDVKKRTALRCEANKNARTRKDDMQQASELHYPVEAWARLGSPEFALNTNYFDIRPQENNSSWLSNGCANPLGMYFDNIMEGATQGTSAGGVYFPGLKYFADEHNNPAPVDTFFWQVSDAGGLLHLVRNSSRESNEAAQYARELHQSGPFVAFSGTMLIPIRNDQADGQPDNGPAQTTRIGMCYQSFSDTLYIFQGGDIAMGLTALT